MAIEDKHTSYRIYIVAIVVFMMAIGIAGGFVVWFLDRSSERADADLAPSSANDFCCPKCGRRNDPERSVCIKCGKPLVGPGRT